MCVDVRVIAASNVDLEEAVGEQRFREDLFYRMNVVPIHIPPLRERLQDIPLLIDHFLEKLAHADSVPRKRVDSEAQMIFSELGLVWQCLQLEHSIQRAVVPSGPREILTPVDFAGSSKLERNGQSRLPAVFLPPSGVNFDKVVGNVEHSLIQQGLAISHRNRARAADLLQIKRTTLLAKMKVLNIGAAGASALRKSGHSL